MIYYLLIKRILDGIFAILDFDKCVYVNICMLYELSTDRILTYLK